MLATFSALTLGALAAFADALAGVSSFALALTGLAVVALVGSSPLALVLVAALAEGVARSKVYLREVLCDDIVMLS
jgi:hypothetical protein